MIRAMALGFFSVDPITRTVSPDRPVSASVFERIVARVLRLGGTPACAAPAAGEPSAELNACGVPMPVSEPITGAEAARALDAIANLGN